MLPRLGSGKLVSLQKDPFENSSRAEEWGAFRQHPPHSCRGSTSQGLWLSLRDYFWVEEKKSLSFNAPGQCPQGPVNEGALDSPWTHLEAPKLRSVHKLMSALLPLASSTTKEDGPFLPGPVWGLSAFPWLPYMFTSTYPPVCQWQWNPHWARLWPWPVRMALQGAELPALGGGEQRSVPGTHAPWCPCSQGLTSLYLSRAGGKSASWTISSKHVKHLPPYCSCGTWCGQ